jgi:hypothetical protein
MGDIFIFTVLLFFQLKGVIFRGNIIAGCNTGFFSWDKIDSSALTGQTLTVFSLQCLFQ